MLKNREYHHALVLHLAKSSFLGIASSNVIGIFIASYILYGSVPSIYILCWVIVSFIIVTVRVYATNFFLDATPNKNLDIKYINISKIRYLLQQ